MPTWNHQFSRSIHSAKSLEDQEDHAREVGTEMYDGTVEYTTSARAAAATAFGGPDRKTLYVTAGKTLYRVPVNVAGYSILGRK